MIALATPAKAIRMECKECLGGRNGRTCESKVCKLNDKSLSKLKQIKVHCMDCVETRQEVKDCTGKLLGENRLCYLHPYRLGHNPRQKGIGNAQNFLKTHRENAS